MNIVYYPFVNTKCTQSALKRGDNNNFNRRSINQDVNVHVHLHLHGPNNVGCYCFSLLLAGRTIAKAPGVGPFTSAPLHIRGQQLDENTSLSKQRLHS